MSEFEELQAKVQELEAEIQKLRETQVIKKQAPRSLCPKEVAEKHGGLMKGGVAWEYNHFPYMHHDDLTNLSRLIRRCCFLRASRSATYVSADNHTCRVKQSKFDYGKTLKEMTDEEYSRYCEILDKVLDVFQEYGCIGNDNW